MGDPALARMRGSLLREKQLRAAFGARDERLVVIASAFGPAADRHPRRAAHAGCTPPQAVMLAAVVDDGSCVIWCRDRLTMLRGDDVADPLVFASMAYARLTSTGRIARRDRLHLGTRVIEVVAEAG